MATRPSILIMTAALALGALLTGCSGEDTAEPPGQTPQDTATTTPSKAASPTPDPTPSEPPATEDADGTLPPGFPDPASLIGQVVHDEQDADGTRHTVVGGAALTLVTTLGACFDGGSGDICGHSVSASVPATSGAPQPATAALVLLLRNNGPLADGTPTWVVLDAMTTTAPGGEAAYLSTCDGTDGVVIWADPDAPAGDTVPVLAAWGPDAGVTAFVEVDPASLSCPWMGD